MWCAYSPPHPYILREYLTTLNNILYVPRSINMSMGWVGMGKIQGEAIYAMQCALTLFAPSIN